MLSREQILLTLGENVRRLRAARELSQERLAELAELDRTYISGIERGERNVSLVNLVRLAHALSAPLGELLSGTDAP